MRISSNMTKDRVGGMNDLFFFNKIIFNEMITNIHKVADNL